MRRLGIRILKWGVLFCGIIGALALGFFLYAPVSSVISEIGKNPSGLGAPINRIARDGLSQAAIAARLNAAGLNYMTPNAKYTSFSGWFQMFSRQVAAAQLKVLATAPEEAALFTREPNMAVPEAEAAENLPEARGILPEEAGSGLDVREYLAAHADPLDNANPEKGSAPAHPRVMLYCTHSSESYTPSSGDTHVAGGKGLINNVAETLAEALTQNGIPAEFVYAAHDWPSYDNSYTESRKTVNQILAAHEGELAALFDVHRDSISSATRADTVTINGQKAARVLLVVGTNQRKPHPNWTENLALAQEIEAAGAAMYPGLIRGITQKAGTYHQELFTGALLLEFGTDLNTLEEAEYAAKLLAGVLVQVLEARGG